MNISTPNCNNYAKDSVEWSAVNPQSRGAAKLKYKRHTNSHTSQTTTKHTIPI